MLVDVRCMTPRTRMNDTCGQLLARVEGGWVEIRCPRCKAITKRNIRSVDRVGTVQSGG